jgi:hypothetical protein
MNTPKQKAAEAAELTKALLNVASDRDSVDAQPHEISPAQSVKIVQATKKIVENSPADLLAAALNKAAKEARR